MKESNALLFKMKRNINREDIEKRERYSDNKAIQTNRISRRNECGKQLGDRETYKPDNKYIERQDRVFASLHSVKGDEYIESVI